MARRRPLTGQGTQTSYFAVLEKNEKEIMVLGRSKRKTKQALNKLMLSNGDKIVKKVAPKGKDFIFGWLPNKKLFKFSTGHVVRWRTPTERNN